MAALPASEIIQAILSAVIDSGGQASLLTEVRTHPRKFRVIRGETAFDLWVYIWTMTHGGASRSEDEFRIQLTTVRPPLELNPNGHTVLLGWSPDFHVFGGFDLSRHQNFRPGSNSVQISRQTLLAAQNFGWGFYSNQFGEIAIAFRPSEFINYVTNATALHTGGAAEMQLFNRIARDGQVQPAEVQNIPAPRQRHVETVSRLLRDNSFRSRVASAYGNRCAVTRVQLKLIDAAHILPVGADNSTDDVTNGICLAPTYHRAFDQGLIFLNERFQMVLNQARVVELQADHLVEGLAHFRQNLGQEVFLPHDPNQRPGIRFVRLANRFRRVG